jgi:hypothetical protein
MIWSGPHDRSVSRMGLGIVAGSLPIQQEPDTVQRRKPAREWAGKVTEMRLERRE